MNKIIRLLVIGLAASALLCAGEIENTETPAPNAKIKKDTVSALLVRGGLFMASDKDFKDIYGSATALGVEVRLGGENLGGWLEGSFLGKSGKLSYTLEETKVKILAAEGGVMYRFDAGGIFPYAGAGVGYYMFNEKSGALGEAKQNKVGFCGMAGASFAFLKPLLVDLKLKYSSCAMKPAYFDINVGGITVSAGLGIAL